MTEQSINHEFGNQQRVRDVPATHDAETEPIRLLEPVQRQPVNWLQWVLLATTLLFAGLFVWAEFLQRPPGSSDAVVGVTPAESVEFYLGTYREGMSQLYAETAAKCLEVNDQGKPVFRDAVAAVQHIETNKKTVEDAATTKMLEVFATIDGNKWTPQGAADVFNGFSEGFEQ